MSPSNVPAIDDAWLNTVSGKKVSYTDPDPDQIDIQDIAHSLSMICRYNGHIRKFYSVAEHSVWVSKMVPQEGQLPLWGLLHDAAEAYIGDMVTPLKNVQPQYMEVEKILERTIFMVFGLEYDLDVTKPKEVKEADERMLATETMQLEYGMHPDWTIPYEPYDDLTIRAWRPEFAKTEFLLRYNQLKDTGINAWR